MARHIAILTIVNLMVAQALVEMWSLRSTLGFAGVLGLISLVLAAGTILNTWGYAALSNAMGYGKMSEQTKTPLGFKPAPHANAQAHARLMKRLGKMSPKQIFKTAVRSGIYTADGQLTNRYRE